MKAPPPARTGYGLQISKEIEGRLGRYRTSIRTAIRLRLDEIAVTAGAGKKTGKRRELPKSKEPPLRFYVYEGYRVFYQIDARTRRVVVLDLARVNS